MKSLIKKAKELLENGTVKLVIGYEKASDNTVRPALIRKPKDTEKLIYNEECKHNLALYLLKPEVKKLGKPCIIADSATLRSILQIASEKQIKEDEMIVLSVFNGKLTEFDDFSSIEAHVASGDFDLPEKDTEKIKEIEAMSTEERWMFWKEQLSRCIKCYACRSSCPMCYCGRCQVEFNQPQIITVEATPVGNFEWHIMRAMHLAGRCVGCGECGRACPENIPIHLLTFKTIQTVKDKFNATAGMDSNMDSVMSNYDINDKEDFIVSH